MINVRQNPKLLSDLYDIFNEADPLGLIKMGAPPDEYVSEIEAAMYRIDEMKDIKTTRVVLHDVFSTMFDKHYAGTEGTYTALAALLFAYLRGEGLI